MAEKQESGGNILVNAAKAIGSAAAAITSLGKSGKGQDEAAAPKNTKPGRLAPKGKSRLPRREKKAKKKADAKAAAKPVVPSPS